MLVSGSVSESSTVWVRRGEWTTLQGMWRTSQLLSRAGVPHGFGAADQGDVRDAELPPRIAVARQVHGCEVAKPAVAGRLTVEADVLLAGVPLGVGVVTADCVPILMADPVAQLAAAVHAGWRGTLKGIVSQAVRALVLEGADPRRLLVTIGPCIRPCCYEVSEDLLGEFAKAFGPTVQRPGSRLDLALANREHLTSLGIPPSNVDDLGECTRCARKGDMYAYFSHRRSGAAAGRQLSWVRAPGLVS